MNKKQRQRLALLGLAALVAVSVAFAWPSLSWPLTPDEETSFQIASAWQRDAIPYRDTKVIGPPGIHFVRMLAGMFFGARPRSMRILELIVVVAAGIAAAQAAAKKRLSPLELAPAMLVSTVFYFTLAGAHHSGQPELWAGLCLLAAQSTIAVDKNRRKAAIVAGLWTGSSVVLAPQAIVFAPLFFAQVLRNALAARPEPEKAPTLVEIPAAFGIGLIQPPAFFAAYFVSRGGFGAMAHSLFAPDPSLRPWRELLPTAVDSAWIPVAIAVALFVPSAIARRSPGTAPLLLLAAVAATLLHPTPHAFVLGIPFVTMLAAGGLVWLGTRWPPLPSLVALAIAAFFYWRRLGPL